MKSKISPRTVRAVRFFLLLIIAVLAGFYRFAIFDKSSFAVGRDAYFHVIQAKSFVETGRTHAPDSSFTPYLLALVYRVTGNWAEAQKILLSLECSLWALIASLLILREGSGKREGEPEIWAAVLAVLPAAFSPAVTLIASEFAKQSLGLVVLAAAVWFLNESLNAGTPAKRNLNRTLAGVAAAAAFFSHRLSGALAVLGLVCVLPWKLALAAAGGGIAIVLLGTFFVPGIAGLFDVERLSGVFSIVPSFHPVSMFRRMRFDLALFLESLVPYVYAGGWTGVAAVRGKEFFRHPKFPLHLFFAICIAVGIFPFYDFKTLDMGYRLFVGSIPLSWIALYFLLRDTTDVLAKPAASAGIAILTAIYLVSGTAVYRPETDPPYGQFGPIITASESYFAKEHIVPEIVIVHHGFSFYYTYVCSRHTLPFVPEWDYDPANTYRLAYGIDDWEWRKYLPRGVQPEPVGMDRDYTLVREDVWRTFVSNCSAVPYMRLKVNSAKNPYEIRPDYLSRFRNTNS